MICLRCFKWAHTREPGQQKWPYRSYSCAGLFSCHCFPASLGKFLTYLSLIHTADRIFSPQFNLDDGKVRNCREEHFFLLGYYIITHCQKTRTLKAEQKQLSSLQKSKQNSQTVHQMSPPRSLNSANHASSWAFIPFPSSSFSPPLYSSVSLFSIQNQ